MSSVTNYVLKVSLMEFRDAEPTAAEEVAPAVEELDAELLRRDVVRTKHTWTRVDAFYDTTAPGKALEMGLYLWAANYVNPAAVAESMRAVTWERPDSVQLFAQGQEEDRLREILWQQVDGTDSSE